MDRLITLGQLLDYYGAFLTERQRTLAAQYACEDCSLSEIAEREGVSRQAVRDAIARAEKELAEMEQKLHLMERDVKMRRVLDEMERADAGPAVKDGIRALRSLLEDEDGV